MKVYRQTDRQFEKFVRSWWYWALTVILFSMQVLFTLNSINQIRYEELAESVTSVYWFKHRSIFYGAYTNVGWYTVLSAIYSLFGFHLFAAKFYRVGLSLVSLLCLAAVLKKYLGVKRAFIPLLTIGLSPTLLYFNSFQAQFGIDLQYFPILFHLIDRLSFKKKFFVMVQHFFAWVFVMVAWASYATIVYYLPALALLYFVKAKKACSGNYRAVVKYSLIGFSGFILPLILITFYIQNRQFLWYDPYVKSGIFRGAGSFTFRVDTMSNMKRLISDLTDKGNSYYYELEKAEFSQTYPLVAIALILGGSLVLMRKKKFRLSLCVAWLLLLFNLIVSNFTADPSGMPGIRRYTGSLTAIYVFFIIVWYYLTSQGAKTKLSQKVGIAACLFLLLHHLVVLPTNLAYMRQPSRFADKTWFAIASTPERSLLAITNEVQKNDLVLSCSTLPGNPEDCRFSEIYAAVSAFCEWNRVACHKVYAYDPYNKQYIKLSVDLWNRYILRH